MCNGNRVIKTFWNCETLNFMPLKYIKKHQLSTFFFFFLVGLEIELRAGDLPVEPHFQSILLWLFWR
jgi:hypothetical protein